MDAFDGSSGCILNHLWFLSQRKPKGKSVQRPENEKQWLESLLVSD